MLLEPTPDQEFLRETTAKFLDQYSSIAELRRRRQDPVGIDEAFWPRGAELGWTSLLVSEENGGGTVSGNGMVDLSLIAYEFGRHAAPGPLAAANAVASALSDHGDAEQAKVLADVLAGTATVGWTGWSPRRTGTYDQAIDIRQDGSDVVIDGVARPVEWGARAGHFLVTGRTGGGLTQVLVPAGSAGISITRLETVDLTRRFDAVRFDAVRVPASAAVGSVGGAAEQVEHQLQVALIVASAETVGSMEVAFDLTVTWAFDRYSFGRPLASYQALKHRYADMKSWLEGSHAITDAAARAVGAGEANAGELASAAKAYTGQFGSELLQDCVQLHGGIGVTFEHDLHLFLRRVTLDRALYGTPEDHRQRLADILEQAENDKEGASGVSAQQTVSENVIGVEEFRLAARTWIADNVRKLAPGESQRTLGSNLSDEEELQEVANERALQRKFFDAGYAGICVPQAYGGQGLTPAHQRAFNDELAGYEYPSRLQVPTFNPLMSVILEFGTEEQKLSHVPAMLRGEEIWMQFLSEPSGGSDVAGALTTAVRDGDEWILNGSKIWTTGAWWSDWGLCLARTNWDVPKHRGLTVFMLPIHQESIEINRIEMLNGSKEFCQEYMTDTRIPDSARVGEVDDGWTVGTKWMFFEKMLYNSPYVTVPAGVARGSSAESMIRAARDAGRLADPMARDLVGEARVLDLVGKELQLRVGTGIRTGKLPEQSAAVARLYSGISMARVRTIEYEIAGGVGAAWSDADDGTIAGAGTDFMMRQSGCIGGGTTEMARNVISERILGMPRERSADRDVAFRDVPRGPTARP